MIMRSRGPRTVESCCRTGRSETPEPSVQPETCASWHCDQIGARMVKKGRSRAASARGKTPKPRKTAAKKTRPASGARRSAPGKDGALLLVGTMKGAFVLRSDASRKKWRIEGP